MFCQPLCSRGCQTAVGVRLGGKAVLCGGQPEVTAGPPLGCSRSGSWAPPAAGAHGSCVECRGDRRPGVGVGGQGPADRKVDVIVKGPGGGSPEHRAARAGGRQPEGVQLHLWGLQVGQPAVWGQGDRAGCCSSQAWERHSLPGGPLNWGKWGGGEGAVGAKALEPASLAI